jgi:hypothetical protein
MQFKKLKHVDTNFVYIIQHNLKDIFYWSVVCPNKTILSINYTLLGQQLGTVEKSRERTEFGSSLYLRARLDNIFLYWLILAHVRQSNEITQSQQRWNYYTLSQH